MTFGSAAGDTTYCVMLPADLMAASLDLGIGINKKKKMK